MRPSCHVARQPHREWRMLKKTLWGNFLLGDLGVRGGQDEGKLAFLGRQGKAGAQGLLAGPVLAPSWSSWPPPSGHPSRPRSLGKPLLPFPILPGDRQGLAGFRGIRCCLRILWAVKASEGIAASWEERRPYLRSVSGSGTDVITDRHTHLCSHTHRMRGL